MGYQLRYRRADCRVGGLPLRSRGHWISLPILGMGVRQRPILSCERTGDAAFLQLHFYGPLPP